MTTLIAIKERNKALLQAYSLKRLLNNSMTLARVVNAHEKQHGLFEKTLCFAYITEIGRLYGNDGLNHTVVKVRSRFMA